MSEGQNPYQPPSAGWDTRPAPTPDPEERRRETVGPLLETPGQRWTVRALGALAALGGALAVRQIVQGAARGPLIVIAPLCLVFLTLAVVAETLPRRLTLSRLPEDEPGTWHVEKDSRRAVGAAFAIAVVVAVVGGTAVRVALKI